MEIKIIINEEGQLEVNKPDEMSALELLGMLSIATSAVIKGGQNEEEIEDDLEDLDEEVEGQMEVDVNEVQ